MDIELLEKSKRYDLSPAEVVRYYYLIDDPAAFARAIIMDKKEQSHA